MTIVVRKVEAIKATTFDFSIETELHAVAFRRYGRPRSRGWDCLLAPGRTRWGTGVGRAPCPGAAG
jgi:hypothetical protein